MIIEESGMKFGDFNDEDVFVIEKSKLLKSAGENVRPVEFLLMRNNSQLIFIEAKSSFPNKANPENIVRFDEAIYEISEKFIHSLEMLLASKVGMYDDTEIPEKIRKLSYKNTKIKMFLVINNFKVEWMMPVDEAIQQKLRGQLKIWNINFKVLNDEMAREYKYII